MGWNYYSIPTLIPNKSKANVHSYVFRTQTCRFHTCTMYRHTCKQLTELLGLCLAHVELCDHGLSHWGRDEIDAILQTTFSETFSWLKMCEFRLKFQWSLFLRVQLTISQHWFRWWLGAVPATIHYLKQWWLDYWRIYASLGLNGLYIQRMSWWNSTVLMLK